MTERIVLLLIGFLAALAWCVAIVSGRLLDYWESDEPNLGLGYLFLTSFFAATGLTYVSWGIWATSRKGRLTKSLLAISIFLMIAMIAVSIAVG